MLNVCVGHHTRTATAEMQAAVVRRYGPPAVVEIAERSDPVPGPLQIRVRVRAASINPIDAKLRAGARRFLIPLRFPAVLGFDFAGEVDALGAEVTAWSEGDAVYGRTDARTGGTHAELAVMRADVVGAMPPGLSFEQAASLPLVTMTAIQGLRQARLGAGDRLLVNGAGGGVGLAAIQVGRAVGATVTGVCSSRSAPLVASFGARVLDYTKGELAATEESFDVILDTVFDSPTYELEMVLEEHGRYVTTGFSPVLALRAAFGRFSPGPRLDLVRSRADGRLMREVSALVEAGLLVPVIDSILPLAQAAGAHARIEQGHVRGTIVLTMP